LANKENNIMIGDSLDADVQGALDMGLDAIFFNTDKVQVEQEIKQVNHLLELKNIYNHEKQILAVLLFISSFGFFNP
jgi:FMN phosphatase YigB (HAD superfamily)